MKFALVDGQRHEAQPGLSGECPGCGRSVVAKCGEDRVRHWAHKGLRACDPWWENETAWHRAWKDQFPTDWQEVVHTAEDGERHIADVKTKHGWVLEFQHSYIKPEERRSREACYQKLIWIVDGTRRKRDKPQLFNVLSEGVSIGPVVKVLPGTCGILREWAGGDTLIFFDLGETQPLWWFADSAAASAYLVQLPRAQFIAGHRSTAQEIAGQFDGIVAKIRKLIALYESRPPIQPLVRDPLRLPRPRRHFRF